MTHDPLKYMTTAEWLKGYAESLDPMRYSALIHKMNLAAELLMTVWEERKEQHDGN